MSSDDFDCFGRALEAAHCSMPAEPASAPASVNPMLLHEIVLSDHRRRDGEAHRRAKALLDAMTSLQRSALAGESGEATLDRIAGLLSSIPQAADPGLAAIVRGIAVRAMVEVSRRPA